MKSIEHWQTIIAITLFLIESYFTVRTNSWLKAMGKEVAKLSTAAQLTKLKEEVNIRFQ